MASKSSGFYGEDLARIHDEAFSAHALSLAPQVVELLRARNVQGRLVELGCGGGRAAELFVNAGFEVHGIDASAAMVKLARARVPRARFVRGVLPDVAIPKCEAVVALGEVFNYLLDEAALRTAIERIAAALPEGALLIFDAKAPSPTREPVVRPGAIVRPDWALFFEVRETPAGDLERPITTFVKRGRDYRRVDELHRQKLWTPKRFVTLLRAAGFRAVARPGIGEEPIGERRFAVIATRAAPRGRGAPRGDPRHTRTFASTRPGPRPAR